MESTPRISETQINRKARSEEFIKNAGLKFNKNLPYTESEGETIPRTELEIARRVSVLAAVNHVAFGNFCEKEISDYLERFELMQSTTNDEKQFLLEPTPEKRNQESWKVECIWTLMWALKIVPELGFPDKEADLNLIDVKNYPFLGLEVDPRHFLLRSHSRRNISELLDQADLYYRLDWACVDARINNLPMNIVHPVVVYERHYALNWLIKYMGQEWDDISCDT